MDVHGVTLFNITFLKYLHIAIVNLFPESGRGLGHVTATILAVRSAILATAWLLVIQRFKLLMEFSVNVFLNKKR